MSKRAVRAPDAETRALSRDPAFRAAIAEGRASLAGGRYATEELERELGITAADKAAARARKPRRKK